MRVGVVFPQTEIGADRGGVRAYAEAAEELGYAHLAAYDHVLGADPAGHPGFSGPYTHRTMFHEVLVLLGFLAGVTRDLELVTSVVIAPQRQTALLAKQAAEVDVLSGGRLRLGLGLGWNDVEYEALGVPFRRRGRRMEEQIGLMRRLWREPVVSFEGEFHRVTAAGLNPLPERRSIPIWIGGPGRAGPAPGGPPRRRPHGPGAAGRRLGADAGAATRLAGRCGPRSVLVRTRGPGRRRYRHP